MKITRLSWAGLQLQHGETTLLIDPVEDFSSMEPYMGKPLKPIINFSETAKADLILLTHLHPDHFDATTIKKCLEPGAIVLAPAGALAKLVEFKIPALALEMGQSFSLQNLSVSPAFAMDGIGHEQISWVVKTDCGQQLFHGGDTIWHSRFWEIHKKFGNFDFVFLPVNGVVVQYPFVGFAPLPASLTPEQAVVAAAILQAGTFIPMHYGTFHAPPVYTEYPEIETALKSAADKYNVKLQFLPEGESI